MSVTVLGYRDGEVTKRDGRLCLQGDYMVVWAGGVSEIGGSQYGDELFGEKLIQEWGPSARWCDFILFNLLNYSWFTMLC